MGLSSFIKSQFVLHLLIGYIFLVSGLIVNLLQLCTLPLWPINRSLYRHVNCRLAYSHWSQLVLLLEWWSGTSCTIYTDPQTYEHFGKEHAIVVLNHNFEIDFLCGWTVCERFGVLGSSKVLAKKQLSYVPLIGWSWYFLEIVFCKRSWAEDSVTVARDLQRLRDYPENFWLLLHCEGTRFTPEKHAISMEVAERKGLPKLKHHLLPRTRGFALCVQNLRGTVPAIYDCTLNFRGHTKPSLLGVVYGRTYKADMCVRRIPMEDIPEDEKECGDWLNKLYKEKDDLQEEYEQSGKFPGQMFQPPRRPWVPLNWAFWASLLLSPLFHFAAGVATSGSALAIAGLIAVVIAASVGVRQLISVTEIDKGSSYGINQSKKGS
ncbi:1-acyl-sn-glycerol-3-phosphate acyltransferase delta [Petromyzon marinus]|uniref:1-acyl-sn-glycerol-3-phosphate acyltransferase delta n=1 Tax=Petromyzon marinus TaxID=7757 RepID=UPI003F71D5D3